MGGAGTERGLPWQHLQCTSAIVYLPLRGLANGAILIGPSLMFPTGGRADSYPSLKREEGESWLAGSAERQRGEAGRGITPPLGTSTKKQHTNIQPVRGKSVFLRGKCKIPWRLGNPSFSISSPPRSRTVPNAWRLGGVLIRLTHEASFLGHQLTEAGLGRDGAQEVSHCPAAEPVAWVLQSPFLPPSPSSTPSSPLSRVLEAAFPARILRFVLLYIDSSAALQPSAVPPALLTLTKKHCTSARHKPTICNLLSG